jgi:tellurite resistance protein TerC
MLFFEKRDEVASMRRSVVFSIAWVGVAMLFGLGLFVAGESTAGTEFLTGYVLERSLSLDNVFVFAIIFAAMAVPPVVRSTVLLWGIIGALILRTIFIVAGAALVESFDWVLYVFGAILLITGIRMAMTEETVDVDPDSIPGTGIVRRAMPVTDGYRSDKLFVREGGHRMATPLLVVVFGVATADVIFAVDSIPAIFGITTDPFIVFAANAFAMLGLRALYRLLDGAQEKFHHLRFGLAFLLVFIGFKMLIEDLWHIPIGLSMGVIVMTLVIAVAVSLLHPPAAGHDGPLPDSDEPPTGPGSEPEPDRVPTAAGSR